jgi:hypothetical protein
MKVRGAVAAGEPKELRTRIGFFPQAFPIQVRQEK